jgi:hypothetical protein
MSVDEALVEFARYAVAGLADGSVELIGRGAATNWAYSTA